MELRRLKQYGWISGPVECRCTACDWGASFTAVDLSVPVDITRAFAEHDCRDYVLPHYLPGSQVSIALRNDAKQSDNSC